MGKLQHEPIQLGLGKRICAFLFDRVFASPARRNGGSRVKGFACGSDLPLLHGLEQRGLCLRRRPVDLVGEHDVCEDRSTYEAEHAPARRAVFFDHLRARDVRGHEVGCELDAAELKIERLSESTDQERPSPGRAHPTSSGVPVGQEARQKAFDDDMLAPRFRFPISFRSSSATWATRWSNSMSRS